MTETKRVPREPSSEAWRSAINRYAEALSCQPARHNIALLEELRAAWDAAPDADSGRVAEDDAVSWSNVVTLKRALADARERIAELEFALSETRRSLCANIEDHARWLSDCRAENADLEQ